MKSIHHVVSGIISGYHYSIWSLSERFSPGMKDALDRSLIWLRTAKPPGISWRIRKFVGGRYAYVDVNIINTNPLR